jgi:hypothetical protein
MNDKCPHCLTPFTDERDDEGKPYCSCDGAEIERLNKEINDLRRALEDMTPGGSEFHGSPGRCLSFIRERMSTATKIVGERNAAIELAERAINNASQSEAKLSAVFSILGNRLLDESADYREAARAILRRMFSGDEWQGK